MADDPQPAARVEDTVQHSQARIGRGLGALGGAALALGVLVLAGALEVGTMGLATPVVVGLGALAIGGVGAAMSAGSNLGADAGRQFMHDEGKIASGLSTILIGPERRFAAHINSNVNCDEHKHLSGGPWPDVVNAGQEQISEGSATVLLGPAMLPAARIGGQGTCEFTIGSGCPTVIIGGPTLRLGPVGEDGRSDDPDKGFFDGVGTASGWIGIFGAALVLAPLGIPAMVAGGAGAWLVGQAAGPVLNLLPEGAPRDAAALALAVLPLAVLPGMARGLSPNEGLKMGEGETPEGFAARVKAAKNAKAEAEWRAKVQASKPRAGEIPRGPFGQPIPAYARAGAGAVARSLFDEGGGVFSRKGPIMEARAAGTGRGGAAPPARDPLFDVTKPETPRSEAEYRRLIDQAGGDSEEAMRLRRERYLQDCERENKPVMPADKWREAAVRAQENRLRGRVDEDTALSRAGVDNNNYASGDREITRYVDSNGYDTRPDGVSDTHWVDVKSTKEPVIYDTDQLRAEREGAVSNGKRQAVIISNDDYQATRPSGPLMKADDTDILHRNNTPNGSNSSSGKWRQWDRTANNGQGGWSNEFGDGEAASILGGALPPSAPP